MTADRRGTTCAPANSLVLLDALYGGIDKFADWITDNRSTFFVSSYTPHTAPHNAYLERLLRERSVPYSSELRSSHLQGMVTFLPAGDISHRDFVAAVVAAVTVAAVMSVPVATAAVVMAVVAVVVVPVVAVAVAAVVTVSYGLAQSASNEKSC